MCQLHAFYRTYSVPRKQQENRPLCHPLSAYMSLYCQPTDPFIHQPMFVNVSSFCEPTHPPRQPLHLPRTLCLLADHDQPTAKEPTSPANPVAYPSCLAYYPANRYWVSDHDYITPLPTSRHWLPNHRPPNPPEDPLPPTPPPDIRRDHHPPITGASADIGSPIQLGARTPRLTDGYWRLALPGVAVGIKGLYTTSLVICYYIL